MDVVIMAGGKGTRLWPMSRQLKPKQFQALMSEQSLLQETYERVRQLAEPGSIFVSTTEDLADGCREQLPNLPLGNVLIEPVARNTGPAIGLVAAWFEQRDPATIVATVASDHVIGRPDRFAQAMRLAEDTVRDDPERLLTIGLTPTWANPGFGYIKARPASDGAGADLRVVEVEDFREKPDPETAQEYLAAGNYYWNASYFIFRADTMMRCIERYAPDVFRGLKAIQAAIGQPDFDDVLRREYNAFNSIPIDTMVFEPEGAAGRVSVVPASLDWDDVGSWETLRDRLAAEQGGDVVTRGEVINVGSTRALVYATAGRLVAVIGLDDVIVVDTDDAVLVCKADRTQDVKTVLNALEEGDPRR